MDRTRIAAGVAELAAALAVAAPAAAAPNPNARPFAAGAPGAGDDYFPFAGNGGYDVAHYDLDLAYDYRTQVLDGTARITATATEKLRQFDLDLRGFDISRLEVNGHPSEFAREGTHELVITPHTR